MADAKTIDVKSLSNKLDSDDLLIDVRTPIEFQEVHAQNAKNVPLNKLDPKEVMEKLDHPADKPVYVICKSGSRGGKAQQQFIDAGFENVVNVEGGTDAWVEAGLPVVKGKKAMSLERQVRIAAGSIVFIGAMLAIFVHPYFAGISAFVGGGLVFAGITDTCAMGMMIARMPWNQVKNESCPV